MSDRPEPKYFACIINEQSSDGNGFVVTSGDLEKVLKDVFTELIRHDIEFELHYQGKDTEAFDYSKVPEFVEKHFGRSGKRYYMEAEENSYKDELGVEIEYGDGFFYHVDAYDLSRTRADVKARLAKLEANKFIYLYEMHSIDSELEEDLREELKIMF
jgi:hypothetical protein